jgi:hypothetical protein
MRAPQNLPHVISAVILLKPAYVYVHIVASEISVNAVYTMQLPVAAETEHQKNCKLIKTGNLKVRYRCLIYLK